MPNPRAFNEKGLQFNPHKLKRKKEFLKYLIMKNEFQHKVVLFFQDNLIPLLK